MQRYVHLVDLEKCFLNEYLVAKIGFDAAKNEPSKVCRSKQAIPTPGHKSGSENMLSMERPTRTASN